MIHFTPLPDHEADRSAGLPRDRLAAVYRRELDTALKNGLWEKARLLSIRLASLTGPSSLPPGMSVDG